MRSLHRRSALTAEGRSRCLTPFRSYVQNGKHMIKLLNIVAARPSKTLRWLSEHQNYNGSTCLHWPFSKDHHGYGLINIGRKTYLAHRIMCRLVHGEPPSKSHEVGHSCGRGHEGCISPQHLFWQTRRQNMLDKRKHGTNGRKRYWYNKTSLTAQDVRQIMALRGKKNQREIGKMFGISYAQVSYVQNGKLKSSTPI